MGRERRKRKLKDIAREYLAERVKSEGDDIKAKTKRCAILVARNPRRTIGEGPAGRKREFSKRKRETRGEKS